VTKKWKGKHGSSFSSSEIQRMKEQGTRNQKKMMSKEEKKDFRMR
jgi:hypothetical protein